MPSATTMRGHGSCCSGWLHSHWSSPAASRVLVREVDGMAMLALERARPAQVHLQMKRGLDVSMSVIGLLIGLPVMIAIAIAIKLTDGGPIIFSQTRVGAGGEPFTMHK